MLFKIKTFTTQPKMALYFIVQCSCLFLLPSVYFFTAIDNPLTLSKCKNNVL